MSTVPSLRPGTELRPEAFARLELAVRNKVEGRLHGDHQGLLPGHGSEQGEARRYIPGDDVRRIDWAVTARTNEPHVRDTIADHELTTLGVIDLSGSLHFGTGRQQKRDVAIEVLGAFGFITAHGANRFGVLALHPDGEKFLPPAAGRHNVHAALRRLSRMPRAVAGREGRVTARVDLETGLRRANRLAPRRGAVVVISDFIGDRNWQKGVRALTERHDVIVVDIVDPRELTLPNIGYVAVADPESGRRRVLDTADRRIREGYAVAARKQHEKIASDIRRTGAAHLRVHTDADWLTDVVRHVEQRRRAPRTRAARP